MQNIQSIQSIAYRGMQTANYVIFENKSMLIWQLVGKDYAGYKEFLYLVN